MVAFVVALVPSLGVLLIFWIGIRALLQADRRERAAQARIEAAERLKARTADAGAAPVNPGAGPAAHSPAESPGTGAEAQ